MDGRDDLFRRWMAAERASRAAQARLLQASQSQDAVDDALFDEARATHDEALQLLCQLLEAHEERARALKVPPSRA